MTRLLVAAYLIEAGLLLNVAPWTNWRQNFFADRWPWLDLAMTTRAAHVIVPAMGCLMVVAGLVDLYALWAGRRRRTRAASDVHHEP